jgi:hypothetical protein
MFELYCPVTEPLKKRSRLSVNVTNGAAVAVDTHPERAVRKSRVILS